jgi:hypothetical protein
MGSEEAISNELSAVSSRAEDPLADARCLHCGYSVRGLPENRCPECGSAFDPADFANTFLPLWPWLLMWYLIIYVFQSLFDLPNIFMHVSSWARGPVDTPWLAVSTTRFLHGILAVTLGPLAIWGLFRRRDWARRICIVVFAAASLKAFAWLGYLPHEFARARDAKDVFYDLFITIARIGDCMLPVLLIAFLITGLRRYSLIRQQDVRAPRLPAKPYWLRHDYLLLIALILAGLGTGRILWGSYWISSSLSYPVPWPQGTGNKILVILVGPPNRMIELMIGMYALAATTLTWRRPQTMRFTLAGLALLSAARMLPGLLHAAAYQGGRGPLASLGGPPSIPSLLMHTAAGLLLPLVLLLFALRAVSREDIDRLARED